MDEPDHLWLLWSLLIPTRGGIDPSVFLAWPVAFLVSVCHTALQTYSRSRLMEGLPTPGLRKRFETYLDQEQRIEAALLLLLLLSEIWFVLSFPSLLPEPGDDGTGVFGSANSWSRQFWSLFLALLILLPSVHAIPKAIVARGNPANLLRHSIPPLYYLSWALFPVLKPLLLWPSEKRAAGNGNSRDAARDKNQVADEIIDVVEEGERSGAIDEGEAQMIEAVLALPELSVSEIMTPRTDLTSIHIDSPLSAALELAHRDGHSKVPVYGKNRDEIAGIFYLRDAIPYLVDGESPQLPELRDVIRQAYFVPETKNVIQLLREFQAEQQSIAIVLDEYGGTAGLITVEDIIEEIVGDIREEHDIEEGAPIQRLDANVISVDPRLRIEEVNEELDLHIPESEDYDTLGGFVFFCLDRIPESGEVFNHENLEFRVLRVEHRRITRLQLRILETQ